MTRLTPSGLLICAWTLLLAGVAAAQQLRVVTDDEWCREYTPGDRDRESHCEVREVTLAAPAVLAIADVGNGSIAVTGSARSDVRLRARVIASAPTEDEARQLVQQVTISTTDGRVQETGPRGTRRTSWWVAYRAEVPRTQDVELSASNGSITIADLTSRVRARTANGSLRLTGAAGGDVDLHTANGSLTIQLSGTGWEGAGLRGRASNGSLRLDLPEGYNARLRAGTGNGSLSVDFPITVQGRIDDDIDAVIGKGGPTIDVRTSNGSLRIGRR